MTKMEQAKEVYLAVNGNRAEFLKQVTESGLLTQAGAATYHMYLTREELGIRTSSISEKVGRSSNTSGMFGQSPAVGLALFTAIF